MPTRVSSPDPPQETQYVSQSGDSQNLWEADCILDERGPAATGSYLVKWKGTDPDTGEIYKPTWEKKSGCTPDLIRDWKKLKKADPSVVGKGTKEIKRVETRSSKRKRANGSAGMKKRTRLRRKSETGGYALVPTVMEVLIDVALGGAKPAVAESSSSVRTRSTMTPPPRPKPSEVPVILKFTQPGPTRIARQTRSSLARAESTDPPPPRTPARAVSESPSGGRTKLVEVEIPIARRQSTVSIRQPTVEKADMEGAEMVTPMDQAVLDDVDIPPDTSLIEETTAALDSFMQGIEGAHRSTGKEIVAGDGDLNGGQLGGLGGEGQADEAPAPTDTVEDGALELEISKNLKTDILLAQTESQDEIAGTKDGRAHTTPLQRKTINISVNIPAQDGPGPTTTKNMQNGSKSSKLGSVPQPSPSVFRPFLPTPEETFHTQTESSIPFSQLDPIVDYSSPAGPAANGPHAIQISAEEVVPDGSPIEAVMGDHDTKEELQDSIPPRVVKRIIDGEEVYVVWSESTEDEKGASQREESPKREDVQLDRQHVWEDEDLAMLTAGSVSLLRMRPKPY